MNLGWTQLSDLSVQYVCRTIQGTLEQLTFTGCRQGMTDECEEKLSVVKQVFHRIMSILGVENLTRRATRLRVLDLSDSSLITDKSVSFVLRYCQQLEHVAFSRCYAIAPIVYA